MIEHKKPVYIIIQEAMAERIRFLEDELSRSYQENEKQSSKIDYLKQVCLSQQEAIMDYEWEKMRCRPVMR